MALQYSAPLPIQELKAAGDGSWEVSGYVSTFGSVDLGGDTILRGAFDATLASGRKVKFLFAHDQSQVLGVPLALKADDHGLFGRFKISRTRLGEDVHTLLKDGAIDSFSIGYFPDEYEFDPETGTRILKSIDLLEASAVAIPMNPDALVTNVKGHPLRLTMDEEASNLLVAFASFVDRSRDVASLRAGDGRRPGAPFFQRLQSVRAAADDLLALGAVPAVAPAPPPAEPELTSVDAPPPPGDPRPHAPYSDKLAIRRRRLHGLGILESSHREHDRR